MIDCKNPNISASSSTQVLAITAEWMPLKPLMRLRRHQVTELQVSLEEQHVGIQLYLAYRAPRKRYHVHTTGQYRLD